ncbi:hypothetical protein DPMN_040197 [Dreissena polymorpha]|uniref:Uncharacterized protein n=1 Tax=Dreissena polymorpha TaxID=45954 RepID=A0A9D4HV29_DREPO|nr:hypothetical protein DPMN_040197 [Dreissena polymorpha]
MDLCKSLLKGKYQRYATVKYTDETDLKDETDETNSQTDKGILNSPTNICSNNEILHRNV